MLRQLISIFFITLFMVSVTAPSIILIVDNSIESSFFYDLSEEEEKGNEKNKEYEIFVLNTPSSCDDYFTSEIEENLGYHFKSYSKPHLNLVSPPPEYYS